MRTLCLVGGTMGAGKTIICKILADDLSDSVFLDGDRCGDLHPLRVTDETKRMLPDDEAKRNAIAKSEPAQRIGYPEDLKGTVIFLAAKASDFVTGSTIYPDGGLHITS